MCSDDVTRAMSNSAQRFNEATEKLAKSGRVQAQADLAEKAVDSDEKTDLDQAELAGKSKARGEDPAVVRKAGAPQKVD